MANGHVFPFIPANNMLKHCKLGLALLYYLGLNPAISFAEPQDTEQTVNYHWGRGLSVPQINLNIGGYFHGSFEHLQSQKSSASLDDTSLFISWSPHNRVRFFSEIEMENWLSTVDGIHSQTSFRVERLYVDLFATESLSLRLGKFLTPFGYWNVIHAAPLVWTTTRPLATDEQLFPSHGNGLMINKSFSFNEQNLDIALYAENTPIFDPYKDTINFDHAFGGRVRYEIFEQLQVGVSYLAFNKQIVANAAKNHLVGLDLLWKKDNYELQMEWSYRHAHDFQGSETNLYLQTVAPLNKHLFVVGRYEYLHGQHEVITSINTHFGIAGLAWRPYTPLIIKTEYRLGSGNEIVAPSGFFTSISMLF